MLDIRTHRTILLQILKDIYTDISISSVLGFKGGTACFLFCDLQRFSVDLDFDLLDAGKEEFVFKKIEDILRNYGEIKEKRIKRYTLFFVLSYSKKAQNIKVEINRRSFDSRYEIKNYLGISMLVMDREDMFAHKLVAMLERGKVANRDIFDIWFFLKNEWEINRGIIEKRTGMKFKKYLKKCIEFVGKLSNRNILAGMGELIKEKHKKWVKESLIKDVLFLLEVKVENEE